MLHPSGNSLAVELARYFRAAAEQRRLLEPRRGDRRWVAEGHTVLHAVDANIVKLFTDPFDVAVRTERRHYGYAEVFPGDDRNNNAIGVGRVLAHFIFFQLGGQNPPPLLLLPPIDQEMREVFRAVLRDAMLEGVKAREQASEIQKVAAQVAKIEDREERARLLVNVAPELFRFLAGSRGPRAEMERFSLLAGGKRIAPLYEALKGDLGANKDWRQAFQTEKNLRDVIALIDRSHRWFDKIKKKSPTKSTSMIQDDAMMLAHLESFNRRLEKNKTRLVLITGDESIHDAARSFIPENEKRTFADLWLRHPRSYLAEPEILSPERESVTEIETGFIKWLDTFLGKLELAGSDYMNSLDKLRLAEPSQGLVDKAANVLENHSSILDEFKERWSAYTRRAILAHYISNNPKTGDNAKTSKLVLKITEQLRDVEMVLSEELTIAWNAVFDAAIEVGYLFARQNNAQRSRNPPVLFFDSLPVARGIVRQILTTEQQSQIDNFVEKLAELRREDHSGYTYTLVFGMLFAAQGSWSVAAILAERALELARSTNCENNITGREAYYLRAVACRHQIRKVASLADIAQMLEQAEGCLADERKIRPNLLNGDLRFAAERVALDVSYRLFQRFCKDKIPDTVSSFDKIKSKLIELLDKNFAGLSSNGLEEYKRWVVRNVERKLLVNLFMVVLLEADPMRPFQQELEPYFNQFKLSVEGENSEEKIPRTFFVDAVYFVTCWWKETNSNNKKALRDAVCSRLSSENIYSNSIMPYDRGRFQYLRNFVIENKY